MDVSMNKLYMPYSAMDHQPRWITTIISIQKLSSETQEYDIKFYNMVKEITVS